jgi:DNA (cytosine-5)-methyltransferase 1
LSGTLNDDVLVQLEIALKKAEELFAASQTPSAGLSERIIKTLDGLHEKAQQASAAFTNIVTCLAIKSARPDADVRYHQTQIQKDTERPVGANFRGISEKVIYPWLNRHQFEGAKSGWQTRTLERPRPYTLDYEENIDHVKTEFLHTFDQIEEHGEAADQALLHIIYKQVLRREQVKITLSIPRTQDIATIVDLFQRHFFRKYGGAKGASRLPVLALHAVYSVIVPELKRYNHKSVRPLEEHSAADSQTGSLGDIEVSDDISGEIFEAVEVKFGMPISEAVIAGVQEKVMDKTIARYYVLTTSDRCEPDARAKKIMDNIKSVHN